MWLPWVDGGYTQCGQWIVTFHPNPDPKISWYPWNIVVSCCKSHHLRSHLEKVINPVRLNVDSDQHCASHTHCDHRQRHGGVQWTEVTTHSFGHGQRQVSLMEVFVVRFYFSFCPKILIEMQVLNFPHLQESGQPFMWTAQIAIPNFFTKNT